MDKATLNKLDEALKYCREGTMLFSQALDYMSKEVGVSSETVIKYFQGEYNEVSDGL